MLVARQRELEALGKRLADKQAVVLVGEAGIGKTTLLRAAAAASGRPVHEGGGLASLSWRSYFPLARAVGAEPPEGDAAFVAEWLAESIGDDVLLLDDLHWADAHTLRLLPLVGGRITLLGAIRREDGAAAAALEACEAAGLERLDVEPLSSAEADEFLRRSRPRLAAGERQRIVEAARGNALLLSELSNGDGRSAELGLVARIERCPPDARAALATLGLLGRPCPVGLLGADAATLRKLGLVNGDSVVAPRHALLAEAAVGSLTPAQRRTIHARLATRIDDPGESARHHLAAGEPAHARRKALVAARAATRRADRAQHLATAALASNGKRADRLRLEAGRELVGVGELEVAATVLDGLVGDDAETRAEGHLVRARLGLAQGETHVFRRELARGLRLVRGSGSPVEVRLQLERAHDAAAIVSPERALTLARRAWRLAHEAGVDIARADAYLGEALSAVGSVDCISYLERAVAGARRAGDTDLELETAFDLIGALDYFVSPARARRYAEEIAVRAASLRSRRSMVQCRWASGRFLMYVDGRLDEAVDELWALQDDRSLGIELDQLRADLALALADRGRDAEASSLLERSLADCGSSFGRDVLLLSKAEADWLAGRVDAVLAMPTALQDGLQPLATLTQARADFELERDVREARDLRESPLGAAIDTELAGLAASSRRDDQACDLLVEAAGLWAGQLVRSELTCLWEAGEAARRAGRVDRARELLLDVAERCEALGFAPLLHRSRRSLRLLGERAPVPRGRNGALTERERQVMAHVAEGLSTRSIAARLLISPATVETHVRAAREKLGARTRAEAAVRAASLE